MQLGECKTKQEHLICTRCLGTCSTDALLFRKVLYDDGVWYTGLLEKGPLLRNGVDKFMVSFDDGEEIW